jgi:hypothetical protein
MSFRSKTDPLELRQQDPLTRWRDKVQRREEEFAQARREREQEDQRRVDARASHEAGLLRNAHEARIADLERQVATLTTDMLAIGSALLDAVKRVAEERMDLAREQREEIRDLKVEVAKLSSTLAEGRVKDFAFAREKDSADLPTFLPMRPKTIN